MSGRVEALWIKRGHRGHMDPTDELTLTEGKGIDSDANFGRAKRQVSVIEKEVAHDAFEDLLFDHTDLSFRSSEVGVRVYPFSFG